MSLNIEHENLNIESSKVINYFNQIQNLKFKKIDIDELKEAILFDEILETNFNEIYYQIENLDNLKYEKYMNLLMNNNVTYSRFNLKWIFID